jgi:glycosyltransferase involved in cell wall biosynthesis
MRIVHVNYVYEPDLSPEEMMERYRTIRRTAETLVEAGHEVYALNRAAEAYEYEENGVHYIFRDDNTRRAVAAQWTYPKDLHRIAGQLQPDIVHVHSLKFYPQMRMLRAELGDEIPIVVQHHAGRPHSAPLSILQRACLEAVDGSFFNGKGNAGEWFNAGILKRWEDVYEAPEGSTDFKFQPQARARRSTGMYGEPAILWVGRMHEAKDPLTVVEGFAEYLERNPVARLYMVFRDGGLSESIAERISKDETLQNAVTQLGELEHEQLADYFGAADIFLTAGHHEGSNYALIEALSCGAFPVCSDIPPHRYLCQDGKYGSFFIPGDLQGCADALEAALEKSSEIPREEILQYFESRLSFPAIGRRLVELYETISLKKSQR